MAREKKVRESSGTPGWLITFSDLMTLLLTFFVLLLSMAVVDERSKLEVLGSVAREFGLGETIHNPTAPAGELSLIEPGKMDLPSEDLEALRDRIFDDSTKDLNFQENKYVQIFSINDEVLFLPGGAILSQKGIQLLDKLLPYLLRIEYPLLVAGHTSTRREEEGAGYSVALGEAALDSMWELSCRRAEAVYLHLRSRGVSHTRLSMEAFGQFRPRSSNNSPDGRRKNRRVDLVLDKRNKEWIEKVGKMRETQNKPQNDYYYKGFHFDLDLPGTTGAPPGGL